MINFNFFTSVEPFFMVIFFFSFFFFLAETLSKGLFHLMGRHATRKFKKVQERRVSIWNGIRSFKMNLEFWISNKHQRKIS